MQRITNVPCANCRRVGPDLDVQEFGRQALLGKHTRTYYAVPKLTREELRTRRRHGPNAVRVYLCGCCKRYILEKSDDASDYWPGMIYKFLVHKNSRHAKKVSFCQKWSLIPRTWRHWWQTEFQHRIEAGVDPVFVDVSNELQEVTEAINELKWARLAKNMDQHFAYPEVRCPWGCSEYLHRTQRLKLKDFLWCYSNYEMQCYETPKSKHWTDSISPSYPTPSLILEKFVCSPSIAMTDDGPMILCCREHSARTINSYLHIAESPTGTIYSPNCNSFAPVAMRSRTNRNFKPNVYSDTFCTMKQVGGFSGIDTSYLTSTNFPTKCDNLSNARDALSIQGRPDIRAQIYDRCSNPSSACFMSQDKVERILARSRRDFPDPSILPEYRTATYVPCETAVRLQELVYSEGVSTIKVFDNNAENDIFKNEVFIPPWPTTFVQVHSMDGHGERFLRVLNKDFGVWMLLCTTGRVTDLWEAIANDVSDNRSWLGHWLTYATSKLNFRGKKKHSRFFPARNIDDLFSAPLSTILKDRTLLEDLFSCCCKVYVTEGSFTELEEVPEGKTVIICINPTQAEGNDSFRETFELRCLLSAKNNHNENLASKEKWRMYVWHRGQQFWVQHGTNHVCKYNGATLRRRAWKGAQIAVYCRRKVCDSAGLQRKYLNAIGGQNYAYCAIHKCPLILNHQRKHRGGNNNHHGCVIKDDVENDVPCGLFGSYICPHRGCNVAICERHLNQTKIQCRQCSPETVMYLSVEKSEFGHYHRDHSDGIIRGRPSPETHGASPATMGPTDAHELAQDNVNGCAFVDDDDSDVSFNGRAIPSGGLSVSTQDSDNSFDDDIASLGDQSGPALDLLLDQGSDSEDSSASETVIGRSLPALDHFDTDGIPTTATGVTQYDISIIENEPEIPIDPHNNDDDIKVPLCVLLNQQGHFLTRTNHKIRMNKLHRSMFERMVSKNESKVIPLVYAEAQLFPTTFWCSLDDGSIPGAIPTALWADKPTLARYGIGSMREHAKMRISNPALPTSVDPHYHFMLLDQLSNLGARGKHTRVVLQRGFADHQRQEGVSFRDKSDHAEIFGETAENHANVHKLAALVQERRPHFFFTQTCNQKTCRGLKVIREWITSAEAICHIHKIYGLDFHEAARYLRESAASFVSRSWNEVADMWMQYIIYSPEAPLGPIDYAWYRKEFQDTQGNLAHIHAILRTLYNIDNPKELEIVLNKIRGCLFDLIHHEEYIKMKEQGIISSLDHLIELLEQAKAYLTHRCHTRCQIPKTTQDGETFFVCKVPDNYFRTTTPQIHSIIPIQVRHLPEAKKILVDLGMILEDKILEECLVSEYHVPISSREDPKFSPTNGELFARFASSQNLQYTTGRMLNDYLVKYCCKMDEVARAEMKPPTHYDPIHARAMIEQLHNTKITSNRIHADKTRKSSCNYGRIIIHTECLSVILAEEIVRSTVQFVHFSTSPREYRQAYFKQGRCRERDVRDMVTYLTNVAQEIRRERYFPQHRLFSRDQMLVINDERSSSLSVDAITVFSVRPPELRFVNMVSLYFCWFERKPLDYTEDTLREELRKRLKLDITKCEWIDGLHMHIVLKRGAISKLLIYATECDVDLFGGCQQKSTMINHLRQIQILQRRFSQDSMDLDDQPLRPRRSSANANSPRSQYEEISNLFLSCDKSAALPIPWTTPVYPKNRGRFLVHILLLFGRFETEYRLMNQPSMKDAYIHAGLFDPRCPEESKRNLLKRYVTECLSSQSGSVQHHDRNLIFANAAFVECLLGEDDELELGTPCVLQAAMRHETSTKIQAQKKAMLSGFIGALYSDLEASGFGGNNLPDRARLGRMHFWQRSLRDNGVDRHSVGEIEYTFPPTFDPDGPQTYDSYLEQTNIPEEAKNTINRYMHGRSHKNVVICGGPGNGKTTVCEELCLYALSKGLRGISTSIVADRSKALGGMHIHLLCALSQMDKNQMTPGRTAESAVISIYRKPELLHFWRELQFLYIDEFGAISAEMLATIDIIARKIKDSSRFLGGMLIICSMDIHQLLPIDGTAMMLSMNMLCEFTFWELKESVRAARDAELKILCNLTRSLEWDDTMRNKFRSIITEKCNFIESFDDPELPQDAIFVFGRRAPCQKIEELLIRQMEDDDSVQLVLSKAEDEESSIAGNWKATSPGSPVTQALSRKLKRKSELYLFEKGRYEFTYNLHGQFQQGQLAILLSIDQDDVDNHRSIEFFKGPPGCKEYPPIEDFTVDFLESNGWERVLVPFESSKPQSLWGSIVGRRSQYGVRLRIASTIHGSQGATFAKLVTAVTNNITGLGDVNFNLWDAAQVVVLLSRTRTCRDLYFIGKPEEVVDHLLSVLEVRSKYMAHITSMTQRLCYRGDHTPVLNGPPMFRPCDIVLDRIPAVYLLVSTRNYGYMYIGETKDIRKRLQDHNSGRGSRFTNNERLRPWALFGYIYGFRTSDNRRLVEQFWKRQVMTRRNLSHVGSPTTVLGIARDIVAQKNRSRIAQHHLRIMQCGDYELRSDSALFRLAEDI